MAKKLSINVSGGPLASGFFSPETIKKAESEEVISTESAPPQTISEELPKPKNKGGRPRLDKKKEQYSLTMDPDLYLILKSKAKEKHRSFSQLVTDVMLDFLNND